MNIYDAIMKAADHIEGNPDDFDYNANNVPGACGTPGCAVGWVGYFAGFRSRHISAVWKTLGVGGQIEFMQRAESLVAGGYGTSHMRRDPAECARALRLYANEYHSHEKPTKAVMPDWNAMASKWTVGDDVRSQELVS